MVFGADNSHSSSQSQSKYKLAPVQDRFLAFVFDMLIFAPIFSFFLSQVLKNIELLYYTAPTSYEFLILLGVCTLMSCILAILFQTVFLLLFGATPGKMFMKLRVVSVFGGPKLSFSQSLGRSTLWTLEILMMGLPMLEVLSHSLRRSLHDRASDTLVVTLKTHGDRGPHFLEAQFVRQMLLAIFLMIITAGIFLTGNVYRMALSGDFAKAELAESKYLCQSVSDRAKAHDNRVDVAMALYLSDTIAAECLGAEADFALWTLSEEQKAWSYYAKMILNSDDEKKKSAYQGKLCSMNSEMCDLSSENLDKISEHSELKKTHTFVILKTKKNLYQSNAFAVKKDLDVLQGMTGFKDFVQSVKIKLFWLEDNQEKALGALDATAPYMSDIQSQKISGWLCHQEMDLGCESKVYSSCNTLKKQISATTEVEDVGTAFALVRESQCKKSALNYTQVEKVFADNKQAFKLLRAIDEKSEMPEAMRKAILVEMATKVTDREDVVADLSKHYVFTHDLDRKEIKLLKNYLENATVQNITWNKLYANTVSAAMKLNDKEDLKSLLALIEVQQLLKSSPKLQEQLGLAFYQIEDFKTSWLLLKTNNSSGSERAPASLDLVKVVRKELSRRFEGQ